MQQDQRFTKVLVANRGEIAVRVLTTAQRMGYATVAVYSEADANAPHVALADEAILLGPAPVNASYLDAARVLAAAQKTGADAIHPGYGFLSENTEFAEACAAAGVVFVGPPPSAMAGMGDKAAARQRMTAAGVPCVPGYDGDAQDLATLTAEAERISYPLLVKAAAGGGGRGMRRVAQADALADAVGAAQAEAQSAFGNGTVLLERLVEYARHVEIQIMADTHGTVIHLGERDCSVQRRYQKVIEEAPSVAVNEALRAKMGGAAVRAAQAIGYVGAGTVEFLLGPDGAYYFLEMNTRLQVEHPVTELVCGGLDLVELQLRVATGEPLGLTQADVTLTGHAIEARLYAEDPYADHRPQTGPVLAFEPAPGVRCDSGIAPEVSAYYDPMVAKLIAYGADRAEAIRKLRRALRTTVLLGMRSNKGYLDHILGHADFSSGDVHTAWLESQDTLVQRPAASDELWALGAVLHVDGDGWRSTGGVAVPLELSLDGDDPEKLWLQPTRTGWQVQRGETQTAVSIQSTHEVRTRVRFGDRLTTAFVARGADGIHVDLDGRYAIFSEAVRTGSQGEREGNGTVASPFVGAVIDVQIAVGDSVELGQTALVIEAMKIQSPVPCNATGTVTEVRVSIGAQVKTGQILVVIEPTAE